LKLANTIGNIKTKLLIIKKKKKLLLLLNQ